jgi:long-chain acyl-CoA synthetase
VLTSLSHRKIKDFYLKLVKNTIGHLLLYRIEQTPHKKAVGFIRNSRIVTFSFQQYKSQVEALSLALIKKGIINQDKVCILSHTRIEWNLFDLAILCSGAITVPIYPTYDTEDISYILKHSQAKMVILENEEQFLKTFKTLELLPDLKFIISIEELSEEVKSKIPSHIFYFSYEKFNSTGKDEMISNPDLFEIKIKSLHDDNIATIIYTSGTTGKPKGAVIRQGALLKMLSNIRSFSQTALNSRDRNLIFLPLSHVLGRCDSFLSLTFGCESIYAESIDKLLQNISMAKPTFMIAVPRIFEKFYEKIQQDLENSNQLKQGLFRWAMNAANKYHEKIDQNKTPSANEIFQYNIAKSLVFHKVYEKFGGKVRFFISGGAPLSKKITQFLRNSDLSLVEGYGLTETIAPCVLNPFNRQKPGTVGKPIGDVEISFGDDSEILIRSAALFDHYFRSEEATKMAKNAAGWFSTGDIGHFDSEGYLVITDRKKDIIITSGGKNIAPQKIEELLKLSSKIEHCVIIGDKRKFLSALIGLNQSHLEKFLNNKSEVTDIIKEIVSSINTQLSSFETIKRFEIIPITLTIDNYLTPSLKVKKKKLIFDFSDLIDAMYRD